MEMLIEPVDKNSFEDIAKAYLGVENVQINEWVKNIVIGQIYFTPGQNTKSAVILPAMEGKVYFITKMVVSGYQGGYDNGGSAEFGNYYFYDPVKGWQINLPDGVSSSAGTFDDGNNMILLNVGNRFTDDGIYRYYNFDIGGYMRESLTMSLGRPMLSDNFNVKDIQNGLSIDLSFMEAIRID